MIRCFGRNIIITLCHGVVIVSCVQDSYKGDIVTRGEKQILTEYKNKVLQYLTSYTYVHTLVACVRSRVLVRNNGRLCSSHNILGDVRRWFFIGYSPFFFRSVNVNYSDDVGYGRGELKFVFFLVDRTTLRPREKL